MDFKRITSALLGFPLVVLVFVLGNIYVVDIALVIIAILSMYEYFHAVSKKSNPVKWLGYLSCLSICLIHILPIQYSEKMLIIAIPTVLLILFIQLIVTNMKTNFNDIAYTFIGIFYIVFFMTYISKINAMEHGKILIWYVILAAWGTDIFAYVIGKTMGKHKFSKVSPKKTIEGCIGGVIGAVILILIYTYIVNTYFNVNYSYTYIAIISIILSLIGQIGDFAASSIKRFVDIKDYSNLIPGHGGMLDRIDSLIFLAPFAFALFTLL